MRLSKERVIKLNEELGKDFKTEFGLLNESNLNYALSQKDPYKIALEILRGHPFIDCNKRTSLMVLILLTTKKKYKEILKDYYDIFKSLSN